MEELKERMVKIEGGFDLAKPPVYRTQGRCKSAIWDAAMGGSHMVYRSFSSNDCLPFGLKCT